MNGISEKVARILALEKMSTLNQLVADVIRVLVTDYGVCWKSELPADLLKLRDFLGRAELVNPKVLDEALDNLQSEGLIKVEIRERGTTSGGSCTDQLIHLVDVNGARSALGGDQGFTSYMFEGLRRVREAVGDKL